METKLDVTLTDFMYAIVVGAAFQRIDAPVYSVQNFYLLIAFIAIIDDWVLYHVQAQKVPASKLAFAKSLVIDSCVLLTWYCAAVSGSHANQNGHPFHQDFLLFIGAFYVFTCIWELVFKGSTSNSGRIVPDLISVVIVVAAYLAKEIDNSIIFSGLLILFWFIARSFAWRRIVFSKESAERVA